MSTTATAGVERASELRAEAAALGKEVLQLREKLEIAQRALGLLQGKRRELTEAAARGKQASPSEIADLAAALDRAQIPVDGLTALLSTKQGVLDAARASLQAIELEIAGEERQAARIARFNSLRAQGGEVAARITEKLRALVEEDLPALDVVRDSLAREFVNVGQFTTAPADAHAREARAVVHQLESAFMDGTFLAVERRLLRAGWQMRGDVKLVIQNLVPPKQ